MTILLAGAQGPALAQRSINLQASPPSTLLPEPPQPPAARPPGGRVFSPAPLPNRDTDAPPPPRATRDPSLSPSLFSRGQQYRGEGYAPGSTAQSEQEKRARPGAGFNLRLPLDK